MKKKVEILSPAGSYESLKAAIAAGADAVYIGGTRFGARAFADNLEEERLLEVIDYVHLHGRKIYLTINTLLKEKELNHELYEYLLPYYKQGIDAVIVQDMGVLQFVKEHFPDLPIHASTQMTITNVLGAKFLEKQGVERVVTAREMHIDEIKEITDNLDVEIESFVHGALCYCYSGQCLYSSLIGGRSGNRGQCAQPCRLPYKVEGNKENQYVLSLKDICTLEHIPDLVEAGIYSFKIEGRMKKPEYVALVTAMYRKYADMYLEKGREGFWVDPQDKQKLMDLYNRGGFHSGYYHAHNGRDMISINRPNHAGVPALEVLRQKDKTVTVKAIVDIGAGDVVELPDGQENFTFSSNIKKGSTTTFTTHKAQRFHNGMKLNRVRNERLIKEIQDTIINKKVKEEIYGKLILKIDEPSKLYLSKDDISVEVVGEPGTAAMNQPVDKTRVEKQLRKTGSTEFEFLRLDIEMDEKLFIPMQSLNELRREGIDLLVEKILSQYRRNSERKNVVIENVIAERKTIEGFHVYTETLEQLDEVIACESVKRIYLDCNAIDRIWDTEKVEDIVTDAHDKGKEIYLGLPHIFRSKTIHIYEKFYPKMLKQKWDGVLVRNYESYEFLQKQGYQGNIVTDYNMYHFNKYAKRFWEKEQIEAFTAPLELNYKELQDVGLDNGELIIYGYFPMMVSAQCVTKTIQGCKMQKKDMVIKDRLQKQFVVRNHCDYCYNVIYNTAPVMLLDQAKEIEALNTKSLRLHFTIENRNQVRGILDVYEKTFIERCDVVDVPDMEFTRGHFKRGIK